MDVEALEGELRDELLAVLDEQCRTEQRLGGDCWRWTIGQLEDIWFDVGGTLAELNERCTDLLLETDIAEGDPKRQDLTHHSRVRGSIRDGVREAAEEASEKGKAAAADGKPKPLLIVELGEIRFGEGHAGPLANVIEFGWVVFEERERASVREALNAARRRVGRLFSRSR